MHELIRSATSFATSCLENRRIGLFDTDLVGKHDERKLTVKGTVLRIAVSIRDQAEHVAVAERSEGGQDIGVELDILKAVLQIDGIEARPNRDR